jgi:hypothetical protein
MKKEISSTKYKKNAIIYFFIFFLPFTITILLVYHIIYQSQQDLKQINFEQLQNYFVQKKKESFLKFLKDAEKHLSFLKETVQISLDDKKIDESERDNLIKYFINFSSRFNIYHQIRLIDKTGKEFIRVDNNGKSFSVDKKNLQDKSDRDYYKQSIVLKDNEYYISKPDLNIENKKIEKPLRPVIRISETLNKDNELYYILIFNIDLKKILKDLSDNAEQNNQIYLADNN